MAKKFGKFLMFTAMASAAAAGVYYYLKEKNAPLIPEEDEDEDFDAFYDEQDEELDRTYVTLTPEKKLDSMADTVKKVFQEAKDTIVTKATSIKPVEGEKIEEFFDDEDEEGDTNE